MNSCCKSMPCVKIMLDNHGTSSLPAVFNFSESFEWTGANLMAKVGTGCGRSPRTEQGWESKMPLSYKLRFDISSMIIGFQEVCKMAFSRFPGSAISPLHTNSNLVENIFCQERGHNGQTSNPTYAQYGPTMNSILLGQTTTTNCSNTGSVENLTFFNIRT